jgi:hypothetical protein
MSFSTEGVRTEESVSKYLTYGINYCKITGINVIKARSTDSKKIQFQMEGAPIGKEFEGVDGAKGKVGRIETSYMSKNEAYKDFMRQIGVIADKLDVRVAVDAVKEASIEAYVSAVEPLLKGRFAWWMFGGEEYSEKKWKMSLLKWGFIKSEKEVDPSTLKMDGYIGVEIRNTSNVVALHFDKTNHFHFNPFVKSEDGFALPGASTVASGLSLPSSSLQVDDLPFGIPSNKPSKLPFEQDEEADGLPFDK